MGNSSFSRFVFWEKLKKSEFFRHVFTLTIGTTFAQAVNFLITPILSRIYQPADYATFSLFTSVVTQISVISTLRLEVAIPSIQEEKEANDLARLALRIALIVSIVSLFGIIFFLILQGSLLKDAILLGAPIAILLTAVNQILNFYSTRIKTYRTNSLSRVCSALATGLLSVLFGWLGYGANGLVYGFIAGLAVGSVSLMLPLFNRIFISSVKANTDSYYLTRFRQFVLINTPHAFLDTLEISGVLILMNHYYSDNTVGSYFFAFRVLLLPVSLIGASVFQVFYQKMSAEKNAGRPVSPLIRSVYIRMAGIGIPIFTFLFFFSEDLFRIIFGANWILSGQLASILCPWLFFNFIASSVSSVSLIYNRQATAILIAGLSMSLRLGILFCLGDILSFTSMLKTLTLISSLAMIFAIWWYHNVPRIYESVLAKKS